MDIKQAFLQLANMFTADDKIRAANLLWCIKKARNAEVLEGRWMNPLAVVRQAQAMVDSSQNLPTVEKRFGTPHVLPKGKKSDIS
jgi:hypothetical protein